MDRSFAERLTARVILFDPCDRILLFQYQSARDLDPELPAERVQSDTYWTTPGGGLLPGESYLDGARRELWEESGIADALFGGVVFEQQIVSHTVSVPRLVHKRYFKARTTRTDISLSHLEDSERNEYRGHRWWTLGELDSISEVIFSGGIAELVRSLIEEDVAQ